MNGRLSVLIILCAIAPAAAGGDGDRLKRLEKQYVSLKETLGIPGLSVAVARQGKVLWAKGFGWADVPRRRPARPDTLYRAASLTKTVTAVVALQMAEEGTLSLDREVPLEDGRAVPLWSLLSHTWQGTPGESFQYTDRAFVLATTVLEVVSGKPYKELVEKRVIGRAGLKAVAGEDDPTNPHLARLASFYGYVPGRSQYAPPGRISRFNGSSGLLASVEDLVRYSRALDDGTLLGAESRGRMWAPRRASTGAFHPYALGWYAGKFGGRAAVWHYGLIPDGGSALLVKVPDLDLTLALLANSDMAAAPFQPGLSAGLLTASPFAADFMRILVEEPAAGKRWPDPDWRLGREGVPAAAGGRDFAAERLAAALMEAWRKGYQPCLSFFPVADPAADHPDPNPSMVLCGEPKKGP